MLKSSSLMQLHVWQRRQHGLPEEKLPGPNAVAGSGCAGEGSSGETARVMRVADGASTSSGTRMVSVARCCMVWHGAIRYGEAVNALGTCIWSVWHSVVWCHGALVSPSLSRYGAFKYKQ